MSTIRKRRRVPFLYSVVNPIFHFLVIKFGLGTRGDQDVLRILRVRGRTSGRTYEIPVRIAKLDGQRYVISMLGESQWARNLRAAGEAQLLAGRTVESVRADEIVGEEKAAFLTWYCQHPEFAQRARYALKAGTVQLTPAEIEHLCRLWPVFRVEQQEHSSSVQRFT
jgi:deazaflavin-dependent oxidoreductase (nitroreductase family)